MVPPTRTRPRPLAGGVVNKVFCKIMTLCPLQKYAVPPTGTRPARPPVEW